MMSIESTTENSMFDENHKSPDIIADEFVRIFHLNSEQKEILQALIEKVFPKQINDISSSINLSLQLLLGGGGNKGILSAIFLYFLSAHPSFHISFSHLHGVSVGALIAALISTNVPAEKILALFTEHSLESFFIKSLYTKKEYKAFLAKFPKELLDIQHATGLASPEKLEKIFESIIGSLKFGDVACPLTIYVVDNKDPKQLIALSSNDPKWKDLPLAKILSAAVALPGFFSPCPLPYIGENGEEKILMAQDAGCASATPIDYVASHSPNNDPVLCLQISTEESLNDWLMMREVLAVIEHTIKRKRMSTMHIATMLSILRKIEHLYPRIIKGIKEKLMSPEYKKSSLSDLCRGNVNEDTIKEFITSWLEKNKPVHTGSKIGIRDSDTTVVDMQYVGNQYKYGEKSIFEIICNVFEIFSLWKKIEIEPKEEALEEEEENQEKRYRKLVPHHLLKRWNQ